MLKIRRVDRYNSSPKPGLRAEWSEWQVLDGRKVICRRDLEHQVREWIKENRPGEEVAIWNQAAGRNINGR